MTAHLWTKGNMQHEANIYALLRTLQLQNSTLLARKEYMVIIKEKQICKVQQLFWYKLLIFIKNHKTWIQNSKWRNDAKSSTLKVI